MPIVVVSGDSSAIHARKAASGVTHVFLAKPFSLAELMAALEELLARRRAARGE